MSKITLALKTIQVPSVPIYYYITSPYLSLDQGVGTVAAGEYAVCQCESNQGTPSFQWFYTTDPNDNPENRNFISSGTIDTKQLRPYSKPNLWQSAYFMETGVFGGSYANTRYVGCLITLGDLSESLITGTVSGIQGTALYQSSVNSGIGYWLSNGGKYYLAEDITFERSAFMWCKNDTKLNLNGHTLTYANTKPLKVYNHSFEYGLSGWDLSNSGTSIPSAYTPLSPISGYALSQISDGLSSLKFSGTTGNGYIQSTGTITIPKDKKWIFLAKGTYGSYEVSNPGVKVYVDLIKTSDGTVLLGGGGTLYQTRNMITISCLSAEQLSLSSSGSGYIPNQTYTGVQLQYSSGQTMVRYPKATIITDALGRVSSVSMKDSGYGGSTSNTTYLTASLPSGTGVSFWISAYDWQFKLAEDTECYVKITLSGHASATHPVYVDDIRVEGADMLAIHGGNRYDPVLYPDWSTNIPGGTLTRGDGSVVKNGYIVQGEPHWRGTCVLLNGYNAGSEAVVSRVNFHVKGHSAHVIHATDSNNSTYHTIQHSVLRSTVSDVWNRDAFDGTIVIGINGSAVRYCQLLDGPHAAIYAGSHPQQLWGSSIYGNTIKMKDRVSNAFSIIAGKGAKIYDNTILNGQNGYHGRGIGANQGISNSLKSEIYNNYIEVQQTMSRQEYSNQTPPGNFAGAYGIQIESEVGGINGNILISGNTIKAYANEQQAYGIRMNMGEFTALSGVEICNNVIHSISSGTNATYSAAFKTLNINSGVYIHDNIIYTNNGLVQMDGGSVLEFINTQINVNNLIASPTVISDIMYYPNWTAGYYYYGINDGSHNASQVQANVTDDSPDSGVLIWQAKTSHTAGAQFNLSEANSRWNLTSPKLKFTNNIYSNQESQNYFDNRNSTSRITVEENNV